MLGLSVLSFSPLHAEEKVGIREMVNRINIFNRLLPQEKVYLHFDNTAYFMGEQMWFKAYVLRSDNNHATNVSKVLYVELLDRSGNVIDTQKLPIGAMGQADGVFDLKKVLAGGFYEVRAYTRYMLNWDSSWLFSRVFPIFEAPDKEGDYSHPSLGDNVWQNRESENVASAKKQDIQQPVETINCKIVFFPEGGHLVENLPCRVAFEIRDKQGMPVNGIGELLDGTGKICSVNTLMEGRGIFAVTPQSGRVYMLHVRDSKGREYRQELPMAEKLGCSLNISPKGKSWLLNLATSNSLATDSLGIVVTAHGALQHVDVVACQRNVALDIPDIVVADGVNRVSVIDGQGRILADRLFFQYPRHLKDSIVVKVKETALQPSQNINLSFQTLPSTTFSLSVRDAATEKNISSLDCENWLLLAGELHGYVSHPEYYFEADDEEHRKVADLLMMVQGWHRYDLSQMMGKRNFKILYPIEKGLSIAGKLDGNKEAVSNQNLRFRLYNELGQSLSGNVQTDSLGFYAIEVPACDGEWKMFVNIPKKCTVRINRNFSPEPRAISGMELMRPQDVTEAMTSFLYTDSLEQSFKSLTQGGSMLTRTHMLPTVVKKKHFWETGVSWDNPMMGKKASYLYYNIDKETDKLLDKGEATPYVYDWLKTRNPAFHGSFDELLEDKSTCSYLRNANVKTVNGETVLLPYCDLSYNNRMVLWILDNQPKCITNCDFLLPEENFIQPVSLAPMPVTMEEVKSVYISDDQDVLKKYLPVTCKVERPIPNEKPMIEYRAINNLTTVFVYTHKMFTKCPKGLRRTFFEGYSPAVEFYSPEYGELPSNEDFRRTLYWNPYVTTDKEGNVDLKICNTGTCKQLIISAEAITPLGRIVKNP